MAKTKPVITCDKCNTVIFDYWLLIYKTSSMKWPEMNFCNADCLRDYLIERKRIMDEESKIRYSKDKS